MTYLIFLVPAWGHIEGGINSFNHDFVSALGDFTLTTEFKVVCISSLAVPAEAVQEAKELNVLLYSLGAEEIKYETSQWLAVKKIIEGLEDMEHCYSIGHDTFTGPDALDFHRMIGVEGRSIFIHHMDYESYANLKTDPDQQSNYLKFEKQESCIKIADIVVAIGPKLYASALRKRGNNNGLFELLPGISDVDTAELPGNFRAMTFGRFDERNDALKQMLLAARSFVVHSLASSPGYDDATFTVVGTSENESIEQFKQSAIEGTGATNSNINGRPYETDRSKLFSLLASQSVCLMLSVHEGFGLVGFEAIAAGVPLILSKNTGLYLFLENLLGKVPSQEHGIFPVSIAGGGGRLLNPIDVSTVKTAYDIVREDIVQYKAGVLELRKLLMETHSWPDCAASFIDAVRRDRSGLPGFREVGGRENLRSIIQNLNRQGRIQPVLDSGIRIGPDPFAFRNRTWRFCGRVSEFERLHAFAYSDKNFDWWSLSGAGGSGKSRLALELIIELIEKGNWNAGFLECPTTFDWSSWNPTHDSLILLDDANLNSKLIYPLLRQCSTRADFNGRRVRVLLIERELHSSWCLTVENAVSAGKIITPFEAAPLNLGPMSQPSLIELIRNFKQTGELPSAMTVADIETNLKQIDHHCLPLYALMGMVNLSRDANAGGTDVIQTSVNLDKERIWANMASTPGEMKAFKRMVAFTSMTGPIAAEELMELIERYPDLFPDQLDSSTLQLLGMYDLSKVYPRQPKALGLHFIRQEFVSPGNPLERVPGLDKISALAWKTNPERMKAFVLDYLQSFPKEDLGPFLSGTDNESDLQMTEYVFDILEARTLALVADKGLNCPDVKTCYDRAKSIALSLPAYDTLRARQLINMLETAAKNDHDTLVATYLDELCELSADLPFESRIPLACCYCLFRLGKHYAQAHHKASFERYKAELEVMDNVHCNDATFELLWKLNSSGKVLEYGIAQIDQARLFDVSNPLTSPQQPGILADEADIRLILIKLAFQESDLQKAEFNCERLRYIFSQDSSPENRRALFSAMEGLIGYSVFHGHAFSELLEEFGHFAIGQGAADAVEEWVRGCERLIKYVFHRDDLLAQKMLERMSLVLTVPHISDQVLNLFWMSYKRGIEFHLANWDLDKAHALYEQMLRYEQANDRKVDPVTQCLTALCFRSHYLKLGDLEKAQEFYLAAKTVKGISDWKFKMLNTIDEVDKD
ncbi:glycosyltransferase [Pedobacter sp. GR22-6]|uniref:glycosyltransferase n=1 Tax=Pedobacter sp. GR22-6 TaxID=3127957 RepID=UPI00307FB518